MRESRKYTALDREHPMVPGGDLDEFTLSALREALAEMRGPVEVDLFVGDGCYYCVESIKLLRQFERLSPLREGGRLLRLRVHDVDSAPELARRYRVERTPTIAMLGGRVRWTGIPSGEEVRSLVETILRISEGASGLSESSKRAVRGLRKEIDLKVVVTPLCPYCPYAVVLSHMIAFESYLGGDGKVRSDAIEAFENPDIAEHYGITTVPAVIIDEEEVIMGLPDEDYLIERIAERA
ncbi:MAG: thioredoxin family protein [Fervidicoccaceae archaeon]